MCGLRRGGGGGGGGARRMKSKRRPMRAELRAGNERQKWRQRGGWTSARRREERGIHRLVGASQGAQGSHNGPLGCAPLPRRTSGPPGRRGPGSGIGTCLVVHAQLATGLPAWQSGAFKRGTPLRACRRSAPPPQQRSRSPSFRCPRPARSAQSGGPAGRAGSGGAASVRGGKAGRQARKGTRHAGTTTRLQGQQAGGRQAGRLSKCQPRASGAGAGRSQAPATGQLTHLDVLADAGNLSLDVLLQEGR